MGYLNADKGRLVRSGIKSEWESQHRQSLSTVNGSSACAPASSRSGSLNTVGDAPARTLATVRSGIKSEWESQQHQQGAVLLHENRALRHQVGVGVSTPSAGCRRCSSPTCAPASSRSGSLNPARVSVFAACAPEVRSGMKSEWESQPRSRRHRERPSAMCAPASSRSGSLNSVDGRVIGTSTKRALRHQVGVGVSTGGFGRSRSSSEVRSGIKSEWESQHDPPPRRTGTKSALRR